jgi:hypothetical protein
MEELRFLRGPCREVISETRFAAESMLHKEYYRKSSVEKFVVVGPKGLDASRKVTSTLTLSLLS